MAIAISDSEGPEKVVGHDLLQIKQADICIIDAQEKIGAEAAQEVVYAKYIKKPVVTVIPCSTDANAYNIGDQQWSWFGPGRHELQNVYTGGCLNAAGGGTSAGTPLIMYICANKSTGNDTWWE